MNQNEQKFIKIQLQKNHPIQQLLFTFGLHKRLAFSGKNTDTIKQRQQTHLRSLRTKEGKTMKKLFTVLAAVFFTVGVFAQPPEKISYQAVIRDQNNNLVTNQAVGMKISIFRGSTIGTIVYEETYNPKPTTNANGLVTVEIGGGIPQKGTFSEIDWSSGTYKLMTAIDPEGGTNYTITGSSQILSVPYALHAKTAESVTGGITETDPVFTAWDKSTGISITESQISDLGNYLTTENQNLDNVLTKGNSAGNKRITNLANPTDARDAATKAYVDALLARIENLELVNEGFTDSRDGSHYKVVKIGNQVWMAENLKYLPSVVGPGTGSGTASYYYVYGYNGTNVANAKATVNYQTYGVLYNWPAAMNGQASSSANPSRVQGVCPTGWHLPSDAEWTQLTDYLGGLSVAGDKLKEAGTAHWNSPNTGATNETGFTALPGGHRGIVGSFNYIGSSGNWWSATERDTDYAWSRDMDYSNSFVRWYNVSKGNGFSVRCVRD